MLIDLDSGKDNFIVLEEKYRDNKNFNKILFILYELFFIRYD